MLVYLKLSEVYFKVLGCYPVIYEILTANKCLRQPIILCTKNCKMKIYKTIIQSTSMYAAEIALQRSKMNI